MKWKVSPVDRLALQVVARLAVISLRLLGSRSATIGRLQAALEEDGAANTLFKGLNCVICHENKSLGFPTPQQSIRE